MANEKLMILKMLEDGKITSTEAARLLESIDRPAAAAPVGSAPSAAPIKPATSARHATASEPRSSYAGLPGNNRPGTSGAPTHTTRAFDDIAVDLSRKFEAFAKDLEPKLQKLTETVAEKTVNLADRISKTLTVEAPASTAPRRSASTPTATASGLEKNIELLVSEGYNELNIAGLNGDVRIKGYNGDKITARIHYKPRRNGAAIELKKLGGKYFLSYEEDDFERVSIDAYVPERLFQVINVSGINGNMDIASLSGEQMQFSNANGQTKLATLAAHHIKADCSTGRLTLLSLTAKNATIENFNGMVEAADLDIAHLSLINFNGGLTLNMSAFAGYSEYLWSVETSNAKMTLNVPTLPDLGYHIKAHTTLGDIRLGLTGLQYIISDPNLIEARSLQFDRATKKVKLAAETSNGALTIN